MNKSRFNFDLWLKELRNDFFTDIPNRDHFDVQKKVYVDCIQAVEAFIQKIETPELVSAAKAFLTIINSSWELDSITLNATPAKAVPKKTGKKRPGGKHMSLVIYALEYAKGDKILLGKIQAVLQTQKSKSAPPGEESLYNWAFKLSPYQKSQIPYFPSVSIKSPQATQWAHKIKSDYLAYLVQQQTKAIVRYKKQPKENQRKKLYTPDRTTELKRIMRKWNSYFSTLEKESVL